MCSPLLLCSDSVLEHDLSRIDHLLLNSVSHKSDLGLTLRPKLIARADEVIGSRPV